jgi:CRP-like cAMP-binding protein
MVPHRYHGVGNRAGYDRAVPTVVDELRRVRLFAGLSQRQLRQLARLVKQREFAAGVAVVEEGTMSGVGFFILAEGEASVSVDGTEVARIGPGDHFGELALITEDARMATVTAVTRLRCHVIAFWDFRKFAKDNPDVAWKLLQHLAGLLTAERERRARASLLLS